MPRDEDLPPSRVFTEVFSHLDRGEAVGHGLKQRARKLGLNPDRDGVFVVNTHHSARCYVAVLTVVPGKEAAGDPVPR